MYTFFRNQCQASGGDRQDAGVSAERAADPARSQAHRDVSRAAVPARSAGYVAEANQPSAKWRIVQITETGRRRIVFIASGEVISQLPGENCEFGDLGWFCRVEDGIATAWTGPAPIVEEPEDDRVSVPVLGAVEA